MSTLKSWLTRDAIQIIPTVENWQAAIRWACQPLIDNESIKPSYVEAIYRSHAAMGPYYILGPGIAMPHARPEEGVNRAALALLVVTDGVNFHSEGNDPVRLLVVLAAQESQAHIEMIAQLAALFDSARDVAAIANATDRHAILKIIEHY